MSRMPQCRSLFVWTILCGLIAGWLTVNAHVAQSPRRALVPPLLPREDSEADRYFGFLGEFPARHTSRAQRVHTTASLLDVEIDESPSPPFLYFDVAKRPILFNRTDGGAFTAFEEPLDAGNATTYPPSLVFVVKHYAMDATVSTAWNFNLQNDVIAVNSANTHYVFMSAGADYCEPDFATGEFHVYAPQNTHASRGLLDVEMNAQRIAASLNGMSNQQLANYWRGRLHFVTDDPLRVGPEQARWFSSQLLCSPNIGGSKPVITLRPVNFSPPATQLGSLKDAMAEAVPSAGTWLKPLFPAEPADAPSALDGIQLAYYGNGCSKSATQPVTGLIALVQRQTKCANSVQVRNAFNKGAVGVVMIAASSYDTPSALSCTSSCTGLTGIAAVMIPTTPGQQMRFYLQSSNPPPPLQLQLHKMLRPATFFAVDRTNAVRQYGNIASKALANLRDELKIFEYEVNAIHVPLARQEAAANETNLTVVPLWSQEPIGQLKQLTVQLPEQEVMRRFDRMQIYLRINCYLFDNVWCTKWDYLFRLYVRVFNDFHNATEDVQIGGWVSGYQMPGVWLTDVDPGLAALASGGEATLVLVVDGWLDSQITAEFRFWRSSSANDSLSRSAPLGLVRLFDDGWFRLDYNNPAVHRRYANYTFRALVAVNASVNAVLPSAVGGFPVVSRLTFYSFTTGHGWGRDVANCAEFCNSQHQLTVSSNLVSTLSFPMAGTPGGCQTRVLDGVTPNQYGTWYYGRGGWCPSLDVKPWIVDLTDVATISPVALPPENEGGDATDDNAQLFGGIQLRYPNATEYAELLPLLPPGVELADITVHLGYKGLYNGQDYQPQADPTPDPNGFAAQIRHTSFLVVGTPAAATT